MHQAVVVEFTAAVKSTTDSSYTGLEQTNKTWLAQRLSTASCSGIYLFLSCWTICKSILRAKEIRMTCLLSQTGYLQFVSVA